VSIDEPVGEVYGGVVAAPVFSAIATRSLKYLGIFPKENVKDKAIVEEKSPPAESEVDEVVEYESRVYYDDELPNLIGLSLREAVSYLRPRDIIVNIVGSGRVYKQLPPPFSSIPKDRKVVLYLKRD